MAPMLEDGGTAPGGAAGAADGDDEETRVGGLGTGGGGYVPPHLRKGAAASGERMGGKYERDDLATLRVTNVSPPRRLRHHGKLLNGFIRSLNSQKRMTFEISSHVSAMLLGFFSPRTETVGVRKGSRSSAMQTGRMLLKRVRNSMAVSISPHPSSSTRVEGWLTSNTRWLRSLDPPCRIRKASYLEFCIASGRIDDHECMAGTEWKGAFN